MIKMSGLKTGVKFVLDGNPFLVVESTLSTKGRGGSFLRTKIKNILTGQILSKTFQPADILEEADLIYSPVQYLYNDGEKYYFMNNDNYEQYELSNDIIGNNKLYLIENSFVSLMIYNGQPVWIELPPSMVFTVISTPPGVRGDTVSGGTKPAKLETNLKVTVPLFIKEGDRILVNTTTNTYLGREK